MFSMLSTPEAHEKHTRWAPTVEEGSIRQQLSTLSVDIPHFRFSAFGSEKLCVLVCLSMWLA
jgi:hypothetical protein